MKYLDLFTGIGGFTLGIEQAYESSNAKRSAERGIELRTLTRFPRWVDGRSERHPTLQSFRECRDRECGERSNETTYPQLQLATSTASIKM